ncbi:RNase adapter RapZ [Weissella halotolerans]|uniref:GlmZ(SRNA)-inactivating NTPase n=1 Tax=Weissella halotolerans DSM 20190 TaxID=1123500 RepID=A0A0R2G4N8_9LACO|nr:RNase adapter RapZ [Weissella halotolerans]KRN32423.1 glmZ(sRNA)-inactivating NTPase [Weissella halotolerans DSM 20190]
MAKKELVILTGMSGAGKTVAMSAFEDLGYFTAQNLPAEMLPRVWELISEEPNIERAAIMIDSRSGDFFADLDDQLSQMKARNTGDYQLRIIFLDASDHELVARYKETRRSHPLAGEHGTLAGIQKERQLLTDMRGMANQVIRTDEFTSKQLRNYLFEQFGSKSDQQAIFSVQVMSFGFKYGLPADADLVMDVRFLKNPYYVPELQPQTGLDQAVADYVWQNADANDYYQQVYQTITWLLPRYKAEGKTTLTIAFGCTGGQHRSVAFAHRLATDLKAANWHVNEYHRDSDRRKG